eukprot:1337862-Prorocentrum_lima.AAC.1
MDITEGLLVVGCPRVIGGGATIYARVLANWATTNAGTSRATKTGPLGRAGIPSVDSENLM